MGPSELLLIFLAFSVLLAFVIYLVKKIDTVLSQKPSVEIRQLNSVNIPKSNVRQARQSDKVEATPSPLHAPNPPVTVGPGPQAQDRSRYENVLPPTTRVSGPQRQDLAPRPTPPPRTPSHNVERASAVGRVVARVTDTPQKDDVTVRATPNPRNPNHDVERATASGLIVASVTETARKRDPAVVPQSSITSQNYYTPGISESVTDSTRNNERVVRALPPVGFVTPDTRAVTVRDTGNYGSSKSETPGAGLAGNEATLMSGRITARVLDARTTDTPILTVQHLPPSPRVEQPTPVSSKRIETQPITENRQTNTPPISLPYNWVTDTRSRSEQVVTDTPRPVGKVRAVVSDPTPPSKILPHVQPPNTHYDNPLRDNSITSSSRTVRQPSPPPPGAVPQNGFVAGLQKPPATIPLTHQSKTEPPPPPSQTPSITNVSFLRSPTGSYNNNNKKDECVTLSDLTEDELEQINKDVSKCSLSMNVSCLGDAVARIRSAAPHGADNSLPLYVIVQFKKTDDKTLTKSEKGIRKSLKIHSSKDDDDSNLCRLARFRFRNFAKDGISSPLDFHDFTPYLGEYAPQYNPFTHRKDDAMRCEWKMCYCETSVGSTKCKNLKYAHILVPK